jgi:hypothetical protein
MLYQNKYVILQFERINELWNILPHINYQKRQHRYPQRLAIAYTVAVPRG